jgi:hypothetical protein
MAPSLFRTKLGIAQRHSNADKVGVFIDQIEVMENAEKIAVPSVVWLQRGDSATDAFGNFLAFCPERGFEAREVFAMREIRAIRRLTRRYGAATDSLIESGSEVVEGVGGSEPKIAGQCASSKLVRSHPVSPS